MSVSIGSTFKKRFLVGLIVSIPAIITISVLIWFFRLIDKPLSSLYESIIGYHIPGLGFVSTIIIIFLIGILYTNVFGKKIFVYIERFFLNIPMLRGIYTAVKQLVDAFSPENKSSFKKFVIVEYPRPGIYAFGFLTKECSIDDPKHENTKFNAVYIPTNNLYLGEIVLFRDEDIFYTNMSIEEGIKIILSGGIAIPPHIKGSLN